MLCSLYIQNYALIEKLDITFENGFSVITGETGAGKSIILGAIILLLGQRADVKSIRTGASKCIIEAHFDVSSYDMQSFFDYFSFLNVTKVAELAGINPSLMRQYTSGVTKKKKKQYDKIRVAVERISKELSAATF